MDVVLSGLLFYEGNLDDLVFTLIPGHAEDLHSVLKEECLTMNLSKFGFGQAAVIYVGNVVWGGQVLLI